MDKSNEVLQFYYWTDEFYKGATREFEEQAIKETEKKDQIIASLRDSYSSEAMSNALLDPKVLLKDAEALKERSIQRLRSTISDLHSKPDLLLKLCLVYVVGLFDAFLTDSAEILLDEYKFRKFKRLPFKEQMLFLSGDFKIDVKSWDSTILQIDEVFARRNLLMHCGGIVDKSYVNRVAFYVYKEGEEVHVDEDYFSRATYDLRVISKYLYAVFKNSRN